MRTTQSTGESGHKAHKPLPTQDNDHDVVVKHAGNGSVTYEDEPDGATSEKFLGVAWFASSITNLDNKWADHWNRLEVLVSQIMDQQVAGLAVNEKQQAAQAKQLDEEFKQLNNHVEGEA